MNITTQKVMKLNGVFHPKSNFKRLFLKRCEGGRPCHILVACMTIYTVQVLVLSIYILNTK